MSQKPLFTKFRPKLILLSVESDALTVWLVFGFYCSSYLCRTSTLVCCTAESWQWSTMAEASRRELESSARSRSTLSGRSAPSPTIFWGESDLSFPITHVLKHTCCVVDYQKFTIYCVPYGEVLPGFFVAVWLAILFFVSIYDLSFGRSLPIREARRHLWRFVFSL